MEENTAPEKTPSPELELDYPWDAQWPTGATLRYAKKATFDRVELVHRCDDGVVLRREVKRGGTIVVSPELADELSTNNPDDWTKEK